MPTCFVYGEWMPEGPGGAWLAGLRLRPATVRGRLWRGPWRRDVLVPLADAAPVPGALVDVPEDRLALLDLTAGVASLPVSRQRVRAVAGLRTYHAETWVLDAARARSAGFRPT